MINEMIAETDLCLLNKPTPNSEKKYRVGRVYDSTNGKGTALCYVDARYVMDTLDDIVGCANWSDKYERIGDTLFCSITVTFINFAGKQCSVTKTDCGTESNVEKQKGEASDAFKRCAVKFGIGRDLYSQGSIFISDGNGLEKRGGKWSMPFGWKPAEPTPVTDGGWVTDEQKARYQKLLSHPHFKGKHRKTNNWFAKYKTFEQAEGALATMQKAVDAEDGKNVKQKKELIIEDN